MKMLPFYFVIKTFLVLWLCLPQTQGAKVIYHHVLKLWIPIIDLQLEKLKVKKKEVKKEEKKETKKEEKEKKVEGVKGLQVAAGKIVYSRAFSGLSAKA